MDIRVEFLRLDYAIQSRVVINEEVVEEYAQLYASGTSLPPIVAFYDGQNYWVADGFHRVLGALKQGVAQMSADVRDGTRRDAMLYSAGANSDHGLRRTNEDKRRAVMMLLKDDEWKLWSDSEIARRCMVSQSFVSELRRLVQDPLASRTYITKHGTKATMNVSHIGKDSRIATRHHIDGDRSNNDISNIFLTTPPGHRRAHSSLDDLAYELVRNGLISFDRATGTYMFSSEIGVLLEAFSATV